MLTSDLRPPRRAAMGPLLGPPSPRCRCRHCPHTAPHSGSPAPNGTEVRFGVRKGGFGVQWGHRGDLGSERAVLGSNGAIMEILGQKGRFWGPMGSPWRFGAKQSGFGVKFGVETESFWGSSRRFRALPDPLRWLHVGLSFMGAPGPPQPSLAPTEGRYGEMWGRYGVAMGRYGVIQGDMG